MLATSTAWYLPLLPDDDDADLPAADAVTSPRSS